MPITVQVLCNMLYHEGGDVDIEEAVEQELMSVQSHLKQAATKAVSL